MTNSLKRRGRHLVFAVLCMTAFGASQAQTYLMSRLPDPETGLSAVETDVLEAKANAGDWEIKQHFAIAYLYEYLSFFSRDQGCKVLKHGGYCRALAEHPKAGRKHLEEIVEQEGTGPISSTDLSALQAEYASYWLIAARLDGYDHASIACTKAVRYYEKATENELLAHPGWSCSARKLAYMVSFGNCVAKDKERTDRLFLQSGSCPSL
jgi:hypothetical protein